MDLSFLSPQQQEVAEEIIEQCIKSRLWFAQNVLGVTLEAWQYEELEKLDAGVSKISIRSGHGVGKTCFCAICALHFVLFRDDVKVVVTSPSSAQLTDGLIPEIRKWVNKLPAWMGKQLEITSERLTRSPSNANNFISFRTARKENPEALAGIHARYVMIIVDEASGVEEVIYETGQGALSTEDSVAILIGNPTRPTGFFYKTQTSLSNIWSARRVSCFDSTQVTQKYVDDIRATYGGDSREFKVRVLGEFPDSGQNQLIPRDYLESAMGRDVRPSLYPTVWGVDPGRGGDPTGFIKRSENALLHVEEIRYDDTMRVSNAIKTKWDKTPPSERPEAIYVDCIGLGYAVADRLNELGLPVIHVNVSELPAMEDQYYRLRDEIYYKLRAWFEKRTVVIPSERDGIYGPLTRKFVEECVAIQEKDDHAGTELRVESKKDMKKRGLKSPNLAEAMAITFAGEGLIAAGMATMSNTNLDQKLKNRVVGGMTKRH